MLLELTRIFQYEFMRNAFLAGSVVAILAGILGYFVVLRRLAFAGHALSHVGFTGATGAVLLGADLFLGMLVFTLGAGLGMGLLGDKLRGRDVAVGSILALSMGLGAFFLSAGTTLSGQATNILFGDVLAISDGSVRLAVLFAVLSLATLAVIYRPLLFASIDPEVAAVRGVPVRLLGVIFMILLAWTTALAVQVVGVLLIFSLLIMPAAAAQHLTARPCLGIAWSVTLALVPVWVGLLLGYYLPYPPGFFITGVSFLLYVAIRGLAPGTGSSRRRSRRGVRDLCPEPATRAS